MTPVWQLAPPLPVAMYGSTDPTLPIQNEYELVGSATYGRVVVYSKRA